MSDVQLNTVAATIAEEEGIRLEVAQQDVRIARQVMLSAAEEESAARGMIARINQDAGFTGEALVKEAQAATDFTFSNIHNITASSFAHILASSLSFHP